MEKQHTDRRKSAAGVGAVALCVAAVLAAGTYAGLWLSTADDRGWLALLPAAALGLTAVLGLATVARARAARRLRAALDAYAERQVATTRRP
jgi:hypothetical protein